MAAATNQKSIISRLFTLLDIDAKKGVDPRQYFLEKLASLESYSLDSMSDLMSESLS